MYIHTYINDWDGSKRTGWERLELQWRVETGSPTPKVSRRAETARKAPVSALDVIYIYVYTLCIYIYDYMII